MILSPFLAMLASDAADSKSDFSTSCRVFAMDSIGPENVSKVFMEAIAAS
jgi:hypothetical protein